MQAFRGMQAAGLQVNVVTWSGLISGLSKQRRRGTPSAQHAYELWKELEASGRAANNAPAYAAGAPAPSHGTVRIAPIRVVGCGVLALCSEMNACAHLIQGSQ